MKFISGEVWLRGKSGGNKDSITVQEIVTRKGSLFLAAVCCGTGGAEDGKTASGFAVEHVLQWLYEELLISLRRNMTEKKWKRSGYKCFYQLYKRLNEYANQKGILLNTSVTLLILYRGRYRLFQVGDSRCGRVRNGISFCGKRLLSGSIRVLTKEDIKEWCGWHFGTGQRKSALRDYRMDTTYKTGRMHRRDGFLLCSDGFYTYMAKEELAEALLSKHIREEKDIKRTLRELAKRAQARGEIGNLSAVYVMNAK